MNTKLYTRSTTHPPSRWPPLNSHRVLCHCVVSQSLKPWAQSSIECTRPFLVKLKRIRGTNCSNLSTLLGILQPISSGSSLSIFIMLNVLLFVVLWAQLQTARPTWSIRRRDSGSGAVHCRGARCCRHPGQILCQVGVISLGVDYAGVVRSFQLWQLHHRRRLMICNSFARSPNATNGRNSGVNLKADCGSPPLTRQLNYLFCICLWHCSVSFYGVFNSGKRTGASQIRTVADFNGKRCLASISIHEHSLDFIAISHFKTITRFRIWHCRGYLPMFR